MISESEFNKILNEGDVKFTKEEAKQIREFVVALATIEYEQFKSNQNERNIDDERYLLQAS